MNKWSEFNESTQNNPPRKFYTEAVDYLESTDIDALDVAAGACVETADMLERGFRVTAFDANPDILDIAKRIGSEALNVAVSSIEDYDYGRERFDLVVALFALPFINPARFEPTFHRIEESLRPGGYFAFHLFGTRDAWSENNKMTFFDREPAEQLVKDYRVPVFAEVEREARLANGSVKHWHLFKILAQKL